MLYEGLKLIMLICVGGCWLDLLVFVLMVSGISLVVMVVVGLFEEFFGVSVGLCGCCVGLNREDVVMFLYANLDVVLILMMIVLVCFSCLIVIVLDGVMKLVNSWEFCVIC